MGTPNPNHHSSHPLCHAVCVAAIVFDVVAKFCTVATNFLMFFSIGSDGVAFMVGASGVGKMYTWSVEGVTGSGLLVGNGFKTSS